LRNLAKIAVEPAITHGIAHEVGSLQPGRLADIVLWRPAFFGVKPELVLKSGYAAWGPLGDGNATVERAEPTRYRPDWGASGLAGAMLGVMFVSAAAGEETTAGKGLRSRIGTRRRFSTVRNPRGLTRAHPRRNRATA